MLHNPAPPIPADVLPAEYTAAYTATVRAGLLALIGPLIDVLAHGHGTITLEIADHQVQRVTAAKSYRPRKAGD